jgi:hypothetical protein
LQNALFGEFFAQRKSKGVGQQVLKRMSKDLARFFKDFFGIEPGRRQRGKNTFPTFEEVLGIVELALQRSESFRGYGLSATSPRLQTLRENLIFLICIILARRLQHKGTLHGRLLNSLNAAGELQSTKFISLNYDILIDNALTDARKKFDYDLDYGVHFANFDRVAAGEDDWQEPRRDRSLQLFKLHGSLNWLYCPTCVGLTLTPKRKGAIELIYSPEDARCEVCTTAAVPIVIPPTFFKVMSNIYLQQIWRGAERALMEADRIIFCGYSLPDADVHLKYMFKRVEVNRVSTPEVFVINNHKGKRAAQKREEEARYIRLFNDPKKIHYTRLSFERFCARGTRALLRLGA